MTITDFEKLDAAFITKMVMARLALPYPPVAEENLFTKKSEALEKTIEDIQSIEDSWKFDTTDTSHTFGRKHAGETIQLWSVPLKSAQVLENLVILTGSKTILEIGTSAGFAALFLSQGALVNNGQVYTIEILAEKATLAGDNFKKAGLENVTLIEAEARTVLDTWDKGLIDFVFLDADKENYGKYLDQLIPLMKIGGIIVADNINDYGHMMEEYLQKVSGTHLPKTRTDHRVKSYYLAALDNGLMITQKISD